MRVLERVERREDQRVSHTTFDLLRAGFASQSRDRKQHLHYRVGR